MRLSGSSEPLSASRRSWHHRALATGAAIGAFALSEPDAGTDAANQQTKAVKSGSGYRITGRKVWVANAEEASVVIVFARTQGFRLAMWVDRRRHRTDVRVTAEQIREVAIHK